MAASLRMQVCWWRMDRGHISVGKCIRTQQLASSMNNIDNGTYRLASLCRLESLHRRRRLLSVLLYSMRSTKAFLILFKSMQQLVTKKI
jgi:hypothetical protein